MSPAPGSARWRPAASNPDLPSSEQRLDRGKDESAPVERREQRQVSELLACRQPRELHFQEFDIVGDRVKVTAGLVGLSQVERVFVCARYGRRRLFIRYPRLASRCYE